MDIQTSKIKLAKLILSIDSPELIEKIRQLLVNENDDLWKTLTASEREEIEYGLDELSQGKRIFMEETFRKI
ncbi:MAG: hypothetical protein GVX78_04425 [Bacteroidetes bacterium]|jgi:hypothetical protein|nr:hypothetical protein [Bacteroidota bacterium]